MGIIISSLIILTLTFLIYFGMYVQLNKLTLSAQTVTVSSEGPAAEMYPDSMGQYNVLRDIYLNDRAIYQHIERKDRFIIYNGITHVCYYYHNWICFNIQVNPGTSHMSCLQMRWEWSEILLKTCLFHNRIGSILEWGVQQTGDKLIYFTTNDEITRFRAGKPCVFPFRYQDVTAYGCILDARGFK